jgi:geranylgeranyl pyrophosphate synthase
VVATNRESGAVARAVERAQGFITQSQAALRILPENESKASLHALAEYAISRNK